MWTTTQSDSEAADYALVGYLEEPPFSLVGELQIVVETMSPGENNSTGAGGKDEPPPPLQQQLVFASSSAPSLESTSPAPPFPVPMPVVAAVIAVPLVLGAFENALVALVLLVTPALRNPRALFLVSLALSDLLLCAFTEPMNLRLLVNTEWPFTAPLATIGAPLVFKELVCRVVLTIQAVNVFASTFSVTAIAAERLNVRDATRMYCTCNVHVRRGNFVVLSTFC